MFLNLAPLSTKLHLSMLYTINAWFAPLYYEAPFKSEDCLVALKNTGEFEAGCNLAWLNVRHQSISGVKRNAGRVSRCKDFFFSKPKKIPFPVNVAVPSWDFDVKHARRAPGCQMLKSIKPVTLADILDTTVPPTPFSQLTKCQQANYRSYTRKLLPFLYP